MPSDSLPGSSWDFSPVYALIQSLSEKPATTNPNDDTTTAKPVHNSYIEDGGVGLGDFSNLWNYLGVSHGPTTPSVPTFESATAKKSNHDGDAYASDGAAYYNQSTKSVRWRDETDGGDIADTQADDSSPSGLDNDGLTKNQRKKRNRKLRKAAELEELQARLSKKNIASPVESGDDSDVPSHAIRIKSSSPASAAHTRAQFSALAGSYPPTTSPKTGPPRFTHATLGDSTFRPMQVAPVSKPVTTTIPSHNDGYVSEHQISAAVNRVAATLRNAPTTLDRPSSTVTHHSLQHRNNSLRPETGRMQSEPPETTQSVPYRDYVLRQQQAAPATSHYATPTKQRNAHDIQPLIHRSAADRNWSLLLKLLNQFPENRDSLLSPLQLSYNHPVPYGIHVFVDASNILIGFMDHLKRARNIPEGTRVPRVYPSFHALALLLERRRPVAKRVLAGSTPHVPAFDEAKQIGYDCNILDKVWKARELTERQRRFAVKAANGGRPASGHGSDSGVNGGALSDTVPHHQQPKWVEQGVDEVLHLKILESILDVSVDAHDASKAGSCERPTMVLATGDAAEAEYSSGFRKMVERALKHGWNVEVMAWDASINYDWRKMEKKSEWQGRFRIITLDDYAEELFSETSI